MGGGMGMGGQQQGRGGKGSGMNLIGTTITGTVREWLSDKGYCSGTG
eukprot:gene14113-22663_t